MAIRSLSVSKCCLTSSGSIFDLVDLVQQVPDSSKTSNDVAKFVKRTLRLLVLLLRFHQLLSVHDDPLLLHVLPCNVQVTRSRSRPRPANLESVTLRFALLHQLFYGELRAQEGLLDGLEPQLLALQPSLLLPLLLDYLSLDLALG